MPSLDDIPTLPAASPSLDDQLAVIDGADRRSPRRTTLSAIRTLTLSGDLGNITANSLSLVSLSGVSSITILSGSFPTEDQQDYSSVWVDTMNGNVLKISTGPA